MKPIRTVFNTAAAILLCAIAGMLLASCSVMSKDVRRDAETDIPFRLLKKDADQYAGSTVIAGGYILETLNFEDQTRLLVLQAPLTVRDEPRDRDLSEGRFVVVYDGFLDPAVYEKGRKITVAGTVRGREPARINGHTFFMPLLDAREIYLWQTPREPLGYYHGDPFHPWPDPYLRCRPYPLFYW